jgi:hypothetical protein
LAKQMQLEAGKDQVTKVKEVSDAAAKVWA